MVWSINLITQQNKPAGLFNVPNPWICVHYCVVTKQVNLLISISVI
ncbi:MAG: hypothetical protein ACTS43_00325 [Candidatus Hodgkinia cicadicola]